MDQEDFKNYAADLTSDGWEPTIVGAYRQHVTIKLRKPKSQSTFRSEISVDDYEKSFNDIEELCDRVANSLNLRLDQIIFIPNFTMPDIEFHIDNELPSAYELDGSISDMLDRTKNQNISSSRPELSNEYYEMAKNSIGCIEIYFLKNKLMEHLIAYNLFENLNSLKNELRQISYIINDEGFKVKFVEKNTEFYIYISKLHEIMHTLMPDDNISEFCDRANEILNKHGYFLEDKYSTFKCSHISFGKMQSNDAGDILKIIYRKK